MNVVLSYLSGCFADQQRQVHLKFDKTSFTGEDAIKKMKYVNCKAAAKPIILSVIEMDFEESK